MRELASEEKPADSASHTITLPCGIMKTDNLWQVNTVYLYPINYLWGRCRNVRVKRLRCLGGNNFSCLHGLELEGSSNVIFSELKTVGTAKRSLLSCWPEPAGVPHGGWPSLKRSWTTCVCHTSCWQITPHPRHRGNCEQGGRGVRGKQQEGTVRPKLWSEDIKRHKFCSGSSEKTLIQE